MTNLQLVPIFFLLAATVLSLVRSTYIINKSDLVNGFAIPRSVTTGPNTSISSVYPVQSLSSAQYYTW